ncbi:MAG: DUF2384 domain-containing protein [Luteitalea sp.]|nr:DUF2384 domain-containing protein [Luteitalea sp.]
MVDLPDVMYVLAGARARQMRMRSWIDFHERLTGGLPKHMYQHVFRLIAAHPFHKDVVSGLERFVVAPATLKRRTDRLSPEESERLARVARLLAMATKVFDDPEDTARFLTRAHPLLGQKSPFELLKTDVGLRQVEDVLARILYGLPV